MRRLGPSSANEMIAAFVAAEIDSARFGTHYAQLLAQLGKTRAILDHPDLTSADENRVRHVLLQRVRGYRTTALFAGFPDEVSWHRISLEVGELGDVRYANHETWTRLSAGSRLIRDGASNLGTIQVVEAGKNINEGIEAVRARVEAGRRFPDLIAFGKRLRTGDIVLAEGHTRATAYVAARAGVPDEILVIAAVSPRMERWAFY